ncbi:MAG: ABC transporter ATP-binding protein [Caldilineaceae bacterium]
MLTPAVLALALALATVTVTIEALLLRGLLDIGQRLNLVGQRMEIYGAILLFLTLLLVLELPMSATMLRIGRRLEMRLRIAFLEKIPHLGDRYFQSRLTSDMTQRVHELRQLRTLPSFGAGLLRLCCQLILTTVAIILFAPQTLLLALLATAFAIGMAAITQPVMQEQDMRFRTHSGALSRFYLDGLLGLVPIRMHGAEQAMRHEHESLLVEWLRAGYAYYNVSSLLNALESMIGSTFAIWILVRYLNTGGEASGVLLLFYWTLSLPALGQGVAASLQQYPVLRNRLLRLLEPLGAPDETGDKETGDKETGDKETGDKEAGDTRQGEGETGSGVRIEMRRLQVQAGGHTILQEIDLQIGAGEHIAIVGRSGAGKSSLVGLLLGWYWPAAGRIYIDGQPLQGELLHTLRRQTAWVDPAVQVWNRSLLENLTYGNDQNERLAISRALTRANLYPVLEKLPNGLQTQLGEGGGLVSGGEGQRVRLGRALLRPNPRLVILDEPFRGLDRAQRRALLAEVRAHWQEATLILISHDVSDTQDFARVLVIDDGRVVEDDAPATLLQQPDSLYHTLFAADEAVRHQLWGSTTWRRLWMENGQLSERY